MSYRLLSECCLAVLPKTSMLTSQCTYANVTIEPDARFPPYDSL